MTQRPPNRPPPLPPAPNLSAYRPSEERQGGAPPAIEHRYRPPTGAALPTALTSAAKPRTPLPKRRRSWLKITAWTLSGLVALTAAGIAALVTFAPVGMLREQLIREVHVRTGRDLVIAGQTSLSLFPALGVTMGDVSLSTPGDMGGAPFVKMKQLEIRVLAMPLLSRKIEIDSLVLSEPMFEFRVDARGRRSWDFAELAGPKTIMVAQAAQRPAGASKGQQELPAELQDFLRNATQSETPSVNSQPATGGVRSSRVDGGPDVALGDVRVINGAVRYRDERAGISEEVRAINARLSGKSLAAPIEAKGDLVLRSDKVDFEGRIGSPRALLEERPTRVALAVNAPRITGRYEGSLSMAKGAHLDGQLKLNAASVRSLAAWAGASVPQGPGLGAFSLEGELKAGPASVGVNNAQAKLDEIAGTGSASVDFVGGRPHVKANLRLGAVDLNPYIAQAGATPPASAPKAGPQVKGFTQRSGWSDQPIDVAALGLVDADARISLAGLNYQDIKVGATQLAIALKNRSLRVNIEEAKLYGGQGRGAVTLEPAGQAAAVGVNVALDGVGGLGLLKDAASFDWIDGKARVQLAVTGNGASQKAIMESLSGKADFVFTDGAIVGFNIPQIIRGLGQGRVSGFNRVPTERTDFSEAGASFQIRNGVAETKDMRAMSPLLRLTGAGTVNLGQRQIDTTLRPKLVGTLSGQGGGGDLTGLELPVKIKGPWEKPQVAPDLEGVLKNPNQAIDAIRDIGRQIQQGKGGSGLNTLIEQFRKR